MERLDWKRNNKIEDIFHKLSRAIVGYCAFHQIGTIVIGYNERWKQNSSMGRRNNQNFVGVPFYQLIRKIKYKAELEGIAVILVEESHTSKCSFLDEELIEHHETYLGQRGVYRSKAQGGNGKIEHGLFRTATGKIINADVNGAYNILRKAFPEFSMDGIEGHGLVPIAVKFLKKDQEFTQLKRFANLNLSSHALAEAGLVDGREIGGVVTGATSYQALSRGITPAEIDQICAQLETNYLILNKNQKNPYVLQKQYPLNKCYKNIAFRKLSNPTIRANLLEIKRYFEKIELNSFYSQVNFSNIFRYLMRLAIEGISEPMIPLPAIIYFIKYLIFGSFKSLPLERQITIYRHILELLAESGSDCIINSEKVVELGV